MRTFAVIDIGTTSIRMAIADIDDEGGVRTLEELSQAVILGRDTFTKGFIDTNTIEDCVRVLSDYRQKLVEYQISEPDQLRVVTTSAVREADNRLAFIDRIYIATGMEVELIDEAEVSRITYHGVQPFLSSEPDLASAWTVVTEVGGGSTEVLILHNGNVDYAHSYRLGSFRLRKTLENYDAPTVKVREIMEAQIERTVRQIQSQVPRDGNVEMVALGGDVRFAVAHIDPSWNRKLLARIPVEALEKITDEMLRRSVDELVQKYHLSFPDAESIGPALLTYVQLARAFKLSRVMVNNTNLRDGLLNEMAVREAWTEDFAKQIVRSAIDLGRKFNFDEAHARHVAELCSKLFHQLQDEHHLDQRYDLILYLAALLHEIGLFVSNVGYHKHTAYLIRNSELFGVGRNDVLLVSQIARYHRRASPRPSHEGYATLPREQRVTVSKLAAILRLAKALDESRSQRISELRCSRSGGQLIVFLPRIEDLSLEQLGLRQSGSLFEEIYGMRVMLRSVRE